MQSHKDNNGGESKHCSTKWSFCAFILYFPLSSLLSTFKEPLTTILSSGNVSGMVFMLHKIFLNIETDTSKDEIMKSPFTLPPPLIVGLLNAVVFMCLYIFLKNIYICIKY